MPLELPGYYFDESRNRYFPVSSKPTPDREGRSAERPTKPPPSHSASPSRNSKKRRRREIIWSLSERLQESSVLHSRRERKLHEILCAQIASTSRVTRATVPALAYGAITSFCTTKLDGQTYSLLGDTRGWLYSLNAPEDAWMASPSSPEFLQTRRWLPELNLASGISSICMSGSRCVATSFGPSCKILVQDLASTDTYILNPGDRVVHDVWSSHLQDRSLVLGANSKAVYIQDIDSARSLKTLSTLSDVFTVYQDHNLVYTGVRNGAISRFDMRMDKPQGQRIFEGRTPKNSVTYLNIIHEWQLLVAKVNGSMATFDLRFPRSDEPLMTFSGHVNEYLPRLPVAVDPDHNFVFAAGQDARIRGWSLRTGKQLEPAPMPSQGEVLECDRPFGRKFNKTVQALQVTEDIDGMCLWAASDEVLHKYHLGQRGSLSHS